MDEKPLFIPLKREFFQAFKAGEKVEEYRPEGPRWNARTCRVGRPVVLSLGYSDDGEDAANKAFKHGGGPCNYTGGGLFQLNPVAVNFGDGDEPRQTFAFADGPRMKINDPTSGD